MINLISLTTKKPIVSTKLSAGIDLFAAKDIVIKANKTAIIPLGVKLDVKGNYKGFYFLLEIRSSLRLSGLIAGTGIIDIDYQDEIKLIVHNLNNDWIKIKKGDKVAQIILMRHYNNLVRGYEIKNKKRLGGFGSTGGKK